MTLTGPLPPELGLENLHQAIGSYVPVAAALQRGQPVDLRLDLSAVRFIWPSGMALLAAMVLAPDRQGRRAGCQVVRPARDKVDSYLTRMDFYNLCQFPADYPWPRLHLGLVLGALGCIALLGTFSSTRWAAAKVVSRSWRQVISVAMFNPAGRAGVSGCSPRANSSATSWRR